MAGSHVEVTYLVDAITKHSRGEISSGSLVIYTTALVLTLSDKLANPPSEFRAAPAGCVHQGAVRRRGNHRWLRRRTHVGEGAYVAGLGR